MNFRLNFDSAKRRLLALLIALAVVATPCFCSAEGKTPVPGSEASTPGPAVSGGARGESEVPWSGPDFILPPPIAVEPSETREVAFIAENTVAMQSMMTAMAVEPSGDVDRDFVETMIPHHQGAIDMAAALLRHGSSERLKRLAQEIIVTQQAEIVAMRLAVGDTLPPSTTGTVPAQTFQAATP